MKKTKMEKGITLIALIITIVVLLILAIVSIGAIRNSKIITHSQDASNDHITGQEKEKIQLALGEWQIQKNTHNNSENFKSVMEEALKNSNVTISGSNDGPLTITFTKTRNKYKVTKDGTISSIAKLEGTQLEKYIFGQELEGRTITDIINVSDSIAFKDDEQTEENETQTIGAEYLEFSQENELGIIYFKVQDITYKFAIDEGTYKTNTEYGIVKVYNPNEESEDSKVGKTVSYDKNTWTIMYDDDTNGLQMICNGTYNYNGHWFYLADNDSSITNWNSLITTADLDNDGSLNDFEKSIYSYNNAITTLNTACESLFKENGNYKNSNIVDVRCVGSNPTSKNSENETPYTSENLAKWPENNSTYSAGIGNGKGKSTDLNCVTDLGRMVALGIINRDTCSYWLASRFVDEDSTRVDFVMFAINEGTMNNSCRLWYVSDSNANGSFICRGLRPVIILSSNVQLQANETGTTDYILN